MAAAVLCSSQDSTPQNAADSPAPSSSGPSNEDIEAVIQMATSGVNGRSPAPKDTRTQLFVGNLPYRVRWQDLKDLFRKAGTVLRADVSLGPDNRSRGYGTVLLATAEDAGRAVDMFNGYNWQTRTLEVRPDRIASDFESPLPGLATPNAGYHSPSCTFPLSSSSRSVPYTSLALDSTIANTSGLSIPTLPPSLDDSNQGHSLSRPGTAAGNGGRNLFVGNLPFHCQWQDLKDLFRQAGTVTRADVALGPDGRSRGFGTVAFATELDAERGLNLFNGHEYNGRLLKVHYDKFSASQSSTVPTSPTPQMGFQGATTFSNYPPTHIAMPFGYPDFGPSSGPNSPYDIYPPYIMMHHSTMQQQSSQPNQSLSPDPQESQPTSSDAHAQSSETTSSSSTIVSSSTSQAPVAESSSSSMTYSTPSSNTHHHHPGRIALPPPSVSAFQVPHTLSPHAISPLHHPMSPIHHAPVLSVTPHGLPPITPSMPQFTFLPQVSPSMHGPSHHAQPPTPGYESVSGTIPGHIMTYAPFSPGLAMSPGTLWGRPGPGVNPYAAVGAPVHVQHMSYGMNAGSPLTDDPGEYFPPVPPQDYFAFVPSSSGLANEVVPDSHREYAGNTRIDSEEKTILPSDSTTSANAKVKDSMNNWPNSDDDDDDDEDERDVEFVTSKMETFRLNGQHPQRRTRSLVSESSRMTELEGCRPSATSMIGLSLPAPVLHRLDLDSVQVLSEQSTQSSSTSAPPVGPHQGDCAETTSDETGSISRKTVAIGLGIRVPGA